MLMLQAAEKNGAGSFATARDCENFICVAGRKKLQRQESISLKSSALYHLSGELVLFQGTNETLFNMGKAENMHLY